MNLSEGRIVFASRNSYTVLCGDIEYFSVLSGFFLQDNGTLPAVGDWVSFYANPSGDSVLHKLHPRQSFISRKSAGREFSENVLAANVDIMLIVAAADSSFSVRRIERFLVLAKSGGTKPVVLISKVDRVDPVNLAVCSAQAQDAAGGAEVVEVSSYTGEGMERLEDLLCDGVTACAVGLSGAGKSTLLNRLSGAEVMDTGDVREYDSKGRHTTTARHMFRLPSGAMFIDTPGLREVGLTGGTEAVQAVFEEIDSAAENCWFGDCSHVHEPGCAVLEAVKNETISRERYDSYIKLRAETENYRIRTEAPAVKKRAGKILSRMVRSENKRKKRF